MSPLRTPLLVLLSSCKPLPLSLLSFLCHTALQTLYSSSSTRSELYGWLLRQFPHHPPVLSTHTSMSSLFSPHRPLAATPILWPSPYLSLVFALLFSFSILPASFPNLLFWCYTARCRPRTACTRLAVPRCLDPVHPWPSQRYGLSEDPWCSPTLTVIVLVSPSLLLTVVHIST